MALSLWLILIAVLCSPEPALILARIPILSLP